MMCPSCKSPYFKESRQCPKYDSIPVCIDCCNSCSHYDIYGMPACRYYINNRSKENAVSPEVAVMSKEIERTKSRIKYYYYRGKKNVALQQEVKLRTLLAKRKELLGKSQ